MAGGKGSSCFGGASSKGHLGPDPHLGALDLIWNDRKRGAVEGSAPWEPLPNLPQARIDDAYPICIQTGLDTCSEAQP